jgi:hypothetical protein
MKHPKKKEDILLGKDSLYGCSESGIDLFASGASPQSHGLDFESSYYSTPSAMRRRWKNHESIYLTFL